MSSTLLPSCGGSVVVALTTSVGSRYSCYTEITNASPNSPSILGEEAAKGALLYTYKHVACGFSAKLTPTQVEEISKRPGVLQVVESGTMRLHESPAKLHNLNV
ncbi:proteinase inhibitor, propeptide, Peptidase S8, subtilisin-related protein [Artemisia annua]|uniref:Proteinase inhibitor, propeptide, Peptidase S8, subtilisin-related protein n=1 Tax=Artemisia annua TaxID=35608 RepID=A0A2U1LHB4_ARTAN|nr:proteinase inhibitor, propeptide, Peptidase S8, subtilisin-related protein [Artemisia annua]